MARADVRRYARKNLEVFDEGEKLMILETIKAGRYTHAEIWLVYAVGFGCSTMVFRGTFSTKEHAELYARSIGFDDCQIVASIVDISLSVAGQLIEESV